MRHVTDSASDDQHEGDPAGSNDPHHTDIQQEDVKLVNVVVGVHVHQREQLGRHEHQRGRYEGGGWNIDQSETRSYNINRSELT